MAINIPAKYKEEIVVNGKNQADLMKLALETVNSLDWATKNVTSTDFYATVGFSFKSFSEVIHIEISKDTVSIESRCVGVQIYDWGKNKDNVNSFKTQLAKLLN